MSTLDWQKTVVEKRKQQSDAIVQFGSHVSSKNTAEAGARIAAQHDAITGIDDAVILAKKIASGEFTSEAVTRAYIARAIKAHEKTNCLTEVLFKNALTRARELDDIYTKTGKPVGALHGVPVSLKDQFNLKGHDTTLGYVGRSFEPATDDAVLVKMLKDLGVVIICKTNVPQSLMWCETENPLWGLTDNPIISGYTPGGSTGGESALMHMHGSLLGWGTDIGGSIRIPSHMMGLYGLKPSSSRFPYTGVPVSTEGQEHVPSSIGPLARSLSTIYHVTKELILQQPWLKDSRCAPVAWRQDIYNDVLSRKLTLGIMHDDGVVRPDPSTSRVIQETALALSSRRHELLDWSPEFHLECIEVMDQFYTADGGEDIRRAVQEGGEPFLPHVDELINRGKPISVFEYWQLNRRKRDLQQAYLEKWNNLSPRTGQPVDALIMPVMPHPAVPHRATRWVGYTKVWNFLDYTVLVIPAGMVMAEDCHVPWEHTPRNEFDQWNSQVWRDNKRDMAERGLPVGIQIVGRRLEEETVLAIGEVLEKALRAGSK